MKDKEYAQDSTKGSSLIQPLNYKGDVLVQVWVDSRVLATLCRWLDSKGQYSRFMSQVVKRPLEVLAEFVVDSGEVEMVDDTGEARSMLERRFNVDLNKGNRGGKNVVHNLTLSDKRGELSERMREAKRTDDVNRPGRMSRFSKMAKQAIEIYENVKLDPNNSMFDEVVIKEKMTDEELRVKMDDIEKKAAEDDAALDEFLASQKKVL